ncbi:MAG: glycogen debranching enzyme [Gammaproteobacteria bacterium]|jgi:predicted glycogen debranching enzyme|nr:glycogen debranching enzyme [Gammaproteobacteria bacterium]
MMLTNPKQSLQIDAFTSKEWLETNETGSYASSSLVECHTRKYHGLLVAKLQAPYGKFVLLSKFDEQVLINDSYIPLSVSQYLNALDARGFTNFNCFDLAANPCFRYVCNGLEITKELLFLNSKNTLLIKYRIQQPNTNAKLLLRPLLAYRSYHALAKANTNICSTATLLENGVTFSPYEEMPKLRLYANGPFSFNAQPYWYYDFAYLEEKARGYDYTEDLFSPGSIELSFGEQQEIILACSIEDDLETDLAKLWHDEIARRQAFAKQATAKEASLWQQIKHHLGFRDRTANLLAILKQQASPQLFVNPNSNNAAIVAGFHWFTEWGRDTMISLPGLTLYSGLEKVCLQILSYFASHEYQGIIPNRIAPLATDSDELDAVDASLWFCWAVQQYYSKTKDLTGIQKNLWQTLKNIVYYYRKGTLFNIKQAANGLIYAGSPEIKLTWMDVKINNLALTPRNGAPVEVNALWYNALCFINQLAEALQDPIAKELAPLIPQVKKSFVEVFWNAQSDCLYDFVNEHESNAQIRPNQIFAVSLPYSPLELKMAQAVTNTVRQHLLTPYGLRTLSPQDPAYHAAYEGDQTQRDTAYHNGTAWPWLLAAFGEALLKTQGLLARQRARKILQPCLQALWQHVTAQAGLACVSEIFDGSAPYNARGCIQQAWSVGELIRLIQILQ